VIAPFNAISLEEKSKALLLYTPPILGIVRYLHR
jgi:hypothetical protein